MGGQQEVASTARAAWYLVESNGFLEKPEADLAQADVRFPPGGDRPFRPIADLKFPVSNRTLAMADHATPNLPAIDLETTSRFYQSLGFTEGWRDNGWMILTRGGLVLEFFPFPNLNPGESSFSCCLRLDDVDGFVAAATTAGVPEQCWGWPRISQPALEASGLRIGYMIDPNGSLVRLIQN